MTDTRRTRRYPPTDIPVRRGYHPKWVSCFPGGVHRWDDGSPDPEEPEEVDPYYEAEALRAAMNPQTLSERLAEMGF